MASALPKPKHSKTAQTSAAVEPCALSGLMTDPTPADKTLAAIAAKAQHAADSIVKAFKQAQLNPERAAQIKDLAARLKVIRDRDRA